jgi:undecaprenyl-diphosphatase
LESPLLYLFSILLGIIEGLTEFLPVSSTAHLRLAEKFLADPFGIHPEEPYWKMYSVVIQLGAILALAVFFLPRIIGFAKTFPRGQTGTRTALTHPLTLTLIGFVVTAGPSYLLHKKIGENLDNYAVMGAALLIGGVAMWVIDVVCTRAKVTNLEQMSVLDAIWIGGVQILSAVFPGTSRSMCTIAAGQVFGFTRSAALEFSFFLSIPTMFAATLFELYRAIFPKKTLGEEVAQRLVPSAMTGEQWMILAIGFVVSFIVAWVVIAWFLNWVRKHGFVPFAVYRILLGAGVLIWIVAAHPQ